MAVIFLFLEKEKKKLYFSRTFWRPPETLLFFRLSQGAFLRVGAKATEIVVQRLYTLDTHRLAYFGI
jgi:hypothetical protein